jgi:hypothetical protein
MSSNFRDSSASPVKDAQPHSPTIFDVLNFLGEKVLYNTFTSLKHILVPVAVSAVGGSLTNYFTGSKGSIDFSRGLMLGFIQYMGYVVLFKHLGMWVYNNTGPNKLSYKTASVAYSLGDFFQIYLPLMLMKSQLPFISGYWNSVCGYLPFFSNWCIVDANAPFSMTLGFICGLVPSFTAFGLTLMTEESEKDVKRLKKPFN